MTDRPGAAGWLDRVPLGLRMTVYAVLFLTLVLFVLPAAALRVDAWLAGWRFSLPQWLRWGGWAFFAALLVVYLGCSWWLTRQGLGAYVEFDPPRRFVASGPFRWCRNPIAACVVGMIAALAVALSSIGMTLLLIVALPLAHVQVVFLEEPLLERRFGQAYRDYRARVPRWIPRPPASPDRRA